MQASSAIEALGALAVAATFVHGQTGVALIVCMAAVMGLGAFVVSTVAKRAARQGP